MAKRKPANKATLTIAHVYVELDGQPVINATHISAEGESVGKVVGDILGQMFLFSDPPPTPTAMEASPRPRKRVASRVVKQIEKKQGGDRG